MPIWEAPDYWTAILKRFEDLRAVQPKLSQAKLAEAIGMQPSNLSIVLRKRGHLSPDQLYQVCKFLELSGSERKLLALLHEKERSTLKSRIAELDREILRLKEKLQGASAALRRKSVKADENAAWTEYFVHPHPSLVHQLLGIERWKRQIDRIPAHLGISVQEFNRCLGVLERCGLITRDKNEITVHRNNVHLDRKDYLSRMHASAFRRVASQVQEANESEDDYFFTATFSADEKTFHEIRASFMEWLKTIGKKVEEAPAEEVYHVNFDLFRPTKTR